jgi:hypothetical protein
MNIEVKRKSWKCVTVGLLARVLVVLGTSFLRAQYPVPVISSLSPTAGAPGGADFTLTVRGTGLVKGKSAVYWDGAALPNPTICAQEFRQGRWEQAFCKVLVPQPRSSRLRWRGSR